MTATLLLLCLLPAAAAAQTGGRVNVTLDPADEIVGFAVNAIKHHFLANGDTTVRHLVEIVSAQSQLYNGQLYYLTLRLTGDSKGDDYCEVVVWYRYWLKDATRLIIYRAPTCSKRSEPVI